MHKKLLAEPSAEEAARMRTEIAECLTEIKKLRDRMRGDQVEIEKSRARTRAMLAHLQAE
jgi:hypothetical protein